MKEQMIGAGEFKTHCLRLLDEVNKKHKVLVITKRGRAIARLTPTAQQAVSLYGCLKGVAVIQGDIVGSTGEVWEADAHD
ncbi:MAG: type II toxin-antitoxin system prevent-host-death family antitoxin [Gammaproteobacteria bacterium]|nr:type II toxin-antitoxin system prevent-host-death family antitoxin [Gammaproteobacteria bacterium]